LSGIAHLLPDGSQDEQTSWFQHAASFGQMSDRLFPKIDCMDSESLVERLFGERQLVAASEMELNEFLCHQSPMSTCGETVHRR